ncbi:MAG: ShlB/FhaC/HecB family hemolysin secretion/activation protein [Almyronema sp.]
MSGILRVQHLKLLGWLSLTAGLWSGLSHLATSWAAEALPAPDASSPQLAQALPPPQDLAPNPQEPPFEELTPLPTLPPLEELLGPQPPAASEDSLPTDTATVVINRFEVAGSTVFSEAELAAVTAPYTGRPVTFAEILQARSAVTQLYVEKGYVTSGAIFPPQPLRDGVATIQVIEGRLETIEVSGTRRLQPAYISSRLGVGASPPLNINRLLEQLQLLQLDPLIENISADLQAGTQPGTNLLVVSVTEADSFGVTYTLDNNRSPSVGSVRHQIAVTEANLLGFGDGLSLGYSTTEGSSSLDFSYTVPINPRNGTLQFAFGTSDSDVIEAPFDILEIEADSSFYELTLRQPLWRQPTQEFAVGLTIAHQESQTRLGLGDIGPFPLSPGADAQGRSRLSALRFFQEWTQRSTEQVIALRSQFNVGLDFLDATVNAGEPDSRFFSWQGQGQWVKLLAPDTLLLLRGSVQLADDPLLTLEQFGLGGQSTVRGYRQDQLLTDSGAIASAELRLPLFRDRPNNGLLQITPFFDLGHGWNNDSIDPDPNTLASIGIGLLYQQNDLTARLDWGMPLISIEDRGNSLQENGFYFSFSYSFF